MAFGHTFVTRSSEVGAKKRLRDKRDNGVILDQVTQPRKFLQYRRAN
jgi:hypothetical protein